MENIIKPRVRFAPSPTGHLHIGGLRAALFNWLFARHYKGVFLLRIEDTDLIRSRAEYTAAILDALAWCKINYDEELVVQSQRINDYQKIAQELVGRGYAYYCYCSPEDLQKRLGANADQEGYAQYDRTCRARQPQADDATRARVIRFKLPDQPAAITFDDLIHGPVSFELSNFDDFILIRSDNMPMYNFAVVIDDAFMRISHVIRGEEHLVNTPKQILLYQACGYAMPQFAHLPLILGADGRKLSKREAATAVVDYKKNGFLPDALCNYLVRLGWSHGDQEIFSRDELMAFFTLEAVGKKGAIFDQKKLEWLNGVYLRTLTADQIVQYILENIDTQWLAELPQWQRDQLYRVIDLYKERVATLRELMDKVTILHDGPASYDCQGAFLLADVLTYLELFEQELRVLPELSRTHVETVCKEVCQRLNIKLAMLAQPLRCALTGSLASPSIFEIIAVLGKEETLRRIAQFKENF